MTTSAGAGTSATTSSTTSASRAAGPPRLPLPPLLLLLLLPAIAPVSGCAASGSAGAPAAAPAAGKSAIAAGAPPALRVERLDPLSGGGGERPAALAALEEEIRRAMTEMAQKLKTTAQPPPYFISYEVFDRDETVVSASYGALVQSSSRRSRLLDTDVRVGSYELDSTHPLRSDSFDLSGFGGERAVAVPLGDDPAALRAVAWLDTGRRYRAAAETLLKVRTQRAIKAAEEDPSDDFSRERPVTYLGAPARITVDRPRWEQRMRALSARFRGHPRIHDSQVTLQASALTRWMVSSEGAVVQDGRNYVRVFMQADTRADDGMELERFESFDAASFETLAGDAAMDRAADAMIADLETLRRAPLADPYIGPAILEGRAAGVFFHEIFGHRVEGHRQKIGQPVMPTFISVYDDPTLTRVGGVDLNGFYRFDDEAVPAARALLVEHGILRGFLLSRSPTRGFDRSNGHGRRQEGRAVVSRQGNLVVEPASTVSFPELRRRLAAEAARQGRTYGLLFRDISGGFTNTQRGGPQAFKVLPILVYRVFVDGRADELVRGADLVGTPLAALTRILAAADDFQTFNGYCGAESGFVPVSATSPSILVEQIEVERKDKGNEKPPVLAAPSISAGARVGVGAGAGVGTGTGGRR
jgi:predicted Zn-dependent protease